MYSLTAGKSGSKPEFSSGNTGQFLATIPFRLGKWYSRHPFSYWLFHHLHLESCLYCILSTNHRWKNILVLSMESESLGLWKFQAQWKTVRKVNSILKHKLVLMDWFGLKGRLSGDHLTAMTDLYSTLLTWFLCWSCSIAERQQNIAMNTVLLMLGQQLSLQQTTLVRDPRNIKV